MIFKNPTFQDQLFIFKALSDEVRFRILVLLSTKTLCVCEIEQALEMSQPRISQHLLKLKHASLIEDNQVGKWKYYSLTPFAKQWMTQSLMHLIKNLMNDEKIQKDLVQLAQIQKTICKPTR